MDPVPQHIESPNLQHHKIKRTVCRSNLREPLPPSRVCPKINRVSRTLQHKRRPQRLKPVEHPPPGKMPRRRRRNLQPIYSDTLRPIQLCYLLGLDAEPAQHLAYPKRRHPPRPARRLQLRQPPNRLLPQMVVVVMGHQHHIHRRQILQSHRRGKKSFWAGPLARRSPLIPYRIDQHLHPIDLNQHRRVPHPRHPQSALRRRRIQANIGPERPERLARRLLLLAAQEPRKHLQDRAEPANRRRDRIQKPPSLFLSPSQHRHSWMVQLPSLHPPPKASNSTSRLESLLWTHNLCYGTS